MKLWMRLSLAISGAIVAIVALMAVSMVALGYAHTAVGRDELGRLRAPRTGPVPLAAATQARPARFLALVAALAAIGVGTGIWVSRGMSKPIAQLAQTARRLAAGDLSSRVKIERSSQEMADLAEAFNGMAAELERAEDLRNNLMADISHELRSPLTVLEGNLRAAIDHVYELDEAELANLYGQTRHLIRLVNDLRELALAESGHLPLVMQEIDVAPLIEEMLWNYDLVAQEKGVTLSARLPDDLGQIVADEARLRQVLSNLISNAVRHTPQGGAVSVEAAPQDGTLVIRIRDTGDGITPEHLPYVYDRFYRTDRSRRRETGGSGLGLSIVRAIVESHGGHVTAASDGPGLGATFGVALPRRPTSPPQSPSPPGG